MLVRSTATTPAAGGSAPAAAGADHGRAALEGWYPRFGKRPFDVVAGSTLLLLLLPLLAAVAVAVLVTLGRPVLVRQERVTLHGRRFQLYKFRTMRPDRRRGAEPVNVERRMTHKHPDDPRLTPFGRRLRRLSLDELPQLLNVVRGDMGLVGPRPELAFIVDTLYEPWQHARHAIRPGLTGLWQITQRCEGEMHRHTATDLRYVERVSLREDLRILWRTVPAALTTCRGT